MRTGRVHSLSRRCYGYEVQIWKAQPLGYNTGSIVGIAKTEVDYKFVPDQWSHYEITAGGDHLVVVLNGAKTLDVHGAKYTWARPASIPGVSHRVQEYEAQVDQPLRRARL
jgi:hypothetical protein